MNAYESACHYVEKAAAVIDDPIDAILGATSKAAVIDAGLGLFRGQQAVTLKITGRDFEARDLALEWDKERFCWRNLGDAMIVGRGQVQQAILDALCGSLFRLPTRSRMIVADTYRHTV